MFHQRQSDKADKWSLCSLSVPSDVDHTSLELEHFLDFTKFSINCEYTNVDRSRFTHSRPNPSSLSWSQWSPIIFARSHNSNDSTEAYIQFRWCCRWSLSWVEAIRVESVSDSVDFKHLTDVIIDNDFCAGLLLFLFWFYFVLGARTSSYCCFDKRTTTKNNNNFFENSFVDLGNSAFGIWFVS